MRGPRFKGRNREEGDEGLVLMGGNREEREGGAPGWKGGNVEAGERERPSFQREKQGRGEGRREEFEWWKGGSVSVLKVETGQGHKGVGCIKWASA